jgi:alkylation response protein AidB-like acyl-CoA dehydrogenase
MLPAIDDEGDVMLDGAATEGAVALVGALARAQAQEAETLRTMPPELVAAARAGGLFGMAAPQSVGGTARDPLTIVTAIEELSYGDGSAGWSVLIGNSTAFFSWLEPSVARAMAGEASDLVSTSMFAPMGRARRDGDELVVDGRWPFNSGCVHADWYQVGLVVMDGERPSLRPDGRPDTRFAYVPRAQAEIIDTWHSLGLRGTGSHDIEVHGLRVPVEHTAAPMLDPAVDDGALWQLGFFPLLGVLMAGFPLGVARRALDELAALAPTKRRGTSPVPVAEDPHVQLEVGRAEAGLLSARAFVHTALGEVWEVVCRGSVPTAEQLGRTGLATQQAMQAAITAVDLAFGFAGAGAVYSGHPLERCFRDLHTANQHIAFSGEGFRAFARTRFGLAA